ncbi:MULTISPECIES: hypothetical protein [Pseudonocardia]|uniref:Alkaline shock protein 23 n=2 Tax=Pseudonocardia TaxID=1847 RepID=A0A1Y2MZ30_PSEAH|nr:MULTISPECIES: hypothetical protein [Pseudonocardia]OSY40435.1 hypothetical protein BG845_02839 [Pseudonocardia autotrophica]TDN72236.1 hypothetical protein C8E95_1291 [Pseudonocardia autotrophica]BBG02946.1 hypothetical protein Pdca_41550 [Pseudonocardia autotrophica]GEC25153.1 hypothetical protein PSA01_21820 [Pseudonocardia saturnea]
MPESPDSPAAVVTGSPGAAAVAAERARDPEPGVLAELVAEAVTAHPAVVRLDGGMFGAVATWLSGSRLIGVHVGGPGEPVEIGVVLNLDHPIPDTVAALRRSVAPLVGATPVDVIVSDVVVPGVALPGHTVFGAP